MSNQDSLRVICRVRPFNIRETTLKSTECLKIESDSEIELKNNNHGGSFNFDHVLEKHTTQENMYKATVNQKMLSDVLNGHNGTIFAYGQTGAGKTWSMEGNINDRNHWGIIPRVVYGLFDCIYNMGDDEDVRFEIKVQYVEIYCEKIRDLLRPDSGKTLNVVKDELLGTFVIPGAFNHDVDNPEDVIEQIELGKRNRKVASTKMNDESSRSHSVFTMKIRRYWEDFLGVFNLACESIQTSKKKLLMRFRQTRSFQVNSGYFGSVHRPFLTFSQNPLHKVDSSEGDKHSTLNLVDLAGSERLLKTGTTGQQAREGIAINQSLTSLGNIMNKLGDSNRDKNSFINYRESKLTLLLQDSLKGTCLTTLVICCSPASDNAGETKGTLEFGKKAKTIKVVKKQNVDERGSKKDMAALIVKLELENKRLKQQLVENGEDLKTAESLVEISTVPELENMIFDLDEKLAEMTEKLAEKSEKLVILEGVVSDLKNGKEQSSNPLTIEILELKEELFQTKAILNDVVDDNAEKSHLVSRLRKRLKEKDILIDDYKECLNQPLISMKSPFHKLTNTTFELGFRSGLNGLVNSAEMFPKKSETEILNEIRVEMAKLKHEKFLTDQKLEGSERELVKTKSVLARAQSVQVDDELIFQAAEKTIGRQMECLGEQMKSQFRSRIKSTEKRVTKPIRAGRHTYSVKSTFLRDIGPKNGGFQLGTVTLTKTGSEKSSKSPTTSNLSSITFL